MDFRGYLRLIRRLPPRLVLARAAELAGRMARASGQLATDIATGSHGRRPCALNPAARIAIAADDISSDLEQTLRGLGRGYLAHRFDLLGSGWVQPVYGFAAAGFLGHRYAPRGPQAPGREGRELSRVVNRANAARASEIWRLISRADYAPIDWQVDARSGYRWSARRPSLTLDIPVDRGADIKLPWELGRLQHLPQLALCAILAGAGRPGFETPARYVAEISDQLADFIATNPPRFGVNWVGVMDVAIRAANMALTLALLAGAGLALPDAMAGVVAQSLDDHADHVITHLEYSETGRSNHYLADLGGLIWANWMLAGPRAITRLKFAVDAMLVEADHQFLADGGTYEGSTGYHRLSAETVLFALALVGSLDHSALDRLDRAQPPATPWRVAFPNGPLRRYNDVDGGLALAPDPIWRKLRKAAQLSRAVQGTDGTIVQIGDTDSGRFFKLHPTALPRATVADDVIAENHLDHRGFTDSMDALADTAFEGARLDAIVVRQLAGGAPIEALQEPHVSPPNFGDMATLKERWNAAADPCRRVRHIPFGVTVDPESWARSAFPDFGLYVFRSGDLLLSFRCSGAPPATAPRGHRHDDNLAIEYRFKVADRRDPGSFVYTPSIEQRNRYRAALAHDVPRVRGWPVAVVNNALFGLEENGHARCLYWRNDGVAGEIAGRFGRILRILHFTPDHLSVFDCVDDPAGLEDIVTAMPISRGYGCL
jgi:hypothetical protein